jgi:LysM repeat protein
MKRILFCCFSLFCIGGAAMAQSADSLFTSMVDGRSMLVVQNQTEATMGKIAADYNVSEELLRLFNEGIAPVVAANAPVMIPLTEQNYFKNPSMPTKDGRYIPLFHTVMQGEKLSDIAKQYIVAETSLMRWNSLSNTSIQADELLLIGWVRFGNEQVAFNKQGSKSALGSVKEGVAETVSTAKVKVVSVKQKLATTTVTRPAIVDSTKKAFRNLGKDLGVGLQSVNEKFKQLQDDVTNSTAKLTKNVSTSYAKERDKHARELAARDAKKNTQSQTRTEVATQASKTTQDMQTQETSAERAIDVPSTPQTMGEEQSRGIADTSSAIAEDASSLYDLATGADNEQEPSSAAEVASAPSAADVASAQDAKILEEAEQRSSDLQAPAVQETKPTVPPSAQSLDVAKTKKAQPCTAGWFYSGELGSEYLVITNIAAAGKDVVITNPLNGKKVRAVVTGKLNAEELRTGLTALLSSAAQQDLGATDDKVKLTIAEIVQ